MPNPVELSLKQRTAVRSFGLLKNYPQFMRRKDACAFQPNDYPHCARMGSPGYEARFHGQMGVKMQIHGFQKTTLLDFPGHVAATVFTGGCNFLCPFCQNGDLVLRSAFLPSIPEEGVIRILEKRKGVLTGVCVTGGEPTLQPDLPFFLEKLKTLGYLVKLDTNGYRPETLRALHSKGLLDYIAMDIKSSPVHYAKAAGFKDLDMAPIRESALFLQTCELPHEFRTTAVRGLHEPEDFRLIGQWLKGSDPYFLQSYVHSEGVISPGFDAFNKDELESFLCILRTYLPNANLRGVE